MGEILRDKRRRCGGAGHGLPFDGTGEAKGERRDCHGRDEGGSRRIDVVQRLRTTMAGRDASAYGIRSRSGNGC